MPLSLKRRPGQEFSVTGPARIVIEEVAGRSVLITIIADREVQINRPDANTNMVSRRRHPGYSPQEQPDAAPPQADDPPGA